MSDTIWTEPKYSGRGYSAVKQYEDDFLYVSRGGLNSHAFVQELGHAPRLIFINFTLMDIMVVGTGEEDAQFMKMLEKNDAALPSRIHNWAIQLLATRLTAKQFKCIIDNAYRRGQKD